MDKTFAAIEKLKEVELELHRLKNYAELMNRAVEVKKEWVDLTEADVQSLVIYPMNPTADLVRQISKMLKEKNHA
jgi:hypothetical protein